MGRNANSKHQYIDRATGAVADEQLMANRIIRTLYSPKLENAPLLAKLASSGKMSQVLGYINYDNALSSRMSGMRRFLRQCGVDSRELVDDPTTLNTARKVFERKIKYWQFRPMPRAEHCVVCPADSRVMVGSLRETSGLFIKGKFFEFPELLGGKGSRWTRRFADGDFAVFRLTPEKYHYTHVPVTGEVADVYSVQGRYYSCNPNAAVRLLTPYSKNRRVVTVLDTDCEGGEQVGCVAMIEVVALMVGQIVQRYSENRYDNPQAVRKGLVLRRGAPKALFRPGSSTVVLLFEPGHVHFATDLVGNQRKEGVRSRYSAGFGIPVVETDVKVRSLLARAAEVEQ
ncbi:MAG TPA: phosphatidylserine decarboxylase [Candidatus Binatia bacterium]|jgi:phosphatidylserine decarboxylase|nr:phosphatidylserine decarboxylase [Candidatus Binatia bacterium]